MKTPTEHLQIIAPNWKGLIKSDTIGNELKLLLISLLNGDTTNNLQIITKIDSLVNELENK